MAKNNRYHKQEVKIKDNETFKEDTIEENEVVEEKEEIVEEKVIVEETKPVVEEVKVEIDKDNSEDKINKQIDELEKEINIMKRKMSNCHDQSRLALLNSKIRKNNRLILELKQSLGSTKKLSTPSHGFEVNVKDRRKINIGNKKEHIIIK